MCRRFCFKLGCRGLSAVAEPGRNWQCQRFASCQLSVGLRWAGAWSIGRAGTEAVARLRRSFALPGALVYRAGVSGR